MKLTDILVECSPQQLREMLDILKPKLPRRIQQYNFIYSYLFHYERINANREKLKSDRWNLRLYTHRYGNIENCTLISHGETLDYIILCFTLQESQEELRECLTQTNLIKWDTKRIDVVCEENTYMMVKEIVTERTNNAHWRCTPFENVMYITKDKIAALQVNENLPEDLYVAPLDAAKHCNLINESWSHKYDQSLGLIQQSIEFNGGLGLFRKGEEQPLCWILVNEFLTPGFLHTVPAERRKGYGELILKMELKRLLKIHNMDLFTFVVVTNEQSLYLHKKLGFESAARVIWLEKPE
ncbi:uncharacterized protein LOC133332166 [Musca vetustissima]|uniref:uncharacterized protein LOC133332166 n=1 Tax=Musca vetustissima TaxID=27455 RepID=UPI002AB7DEFA|nr:uncharacterized protein LOC133332166 [Musca vetustissima]